MFEYFGSHENSHDCHHNATVFCTEAKQQQCHASSIFVKTEKPKGASFGLFKMKSKCQKQCLKEPKMQCKAQCKKSASMDVTLAGVLVYLNPRSRGAYFL